MRKKVKEIKFSIIMPTYNDAETIVNAIESVVKQEYDRWELVIVNDGSTDDTLNIVNNYLKTVDSKNIVLLSKENGDQLNAIKFGAGHITGDVVYILHSDDEFSNDQVLKRVNDVFCENSIDAVIPRFLPIINENGERNRVIKVNSYKNNPKTLGVMALRFGENIYIDMAFVRKEIFEKEYFYNYLTWNRPFWANIENSTVMNVKSVNFEIFNYRVFSGNYANSEIGKLNVYNGILRTYIDLLNKVKIPFFRFQRFIYKTMRRVGLQNFVPTISMFRKTEDISLYLKLMIPQELLNFEYFKAINLFYKLHSSRTINLTIPSGEIIYNGADARIFNKKMIKGELSTFYYDFMNEMELGFGSVVVEKEQLEQVQNLLHFFCISNYVSVMVK